MLLKSCRCGKLIPQSMKMCEECEQRQQSRHMIYNNTRRDKRAAEFYVSKEWRAMREHIIEVYDNVDIYALYVENELLTCEPVHHIVELEDDWEQRLNPFNLIPLNHKTHNTIGIVYVVGAVVVFLAMTAFYIWVDRASKKEQELYYDEYYYPDDEFAERMSVVVWFILSLGCAILWVGIPLLICGLIVYTELEEHCPELMGDMTDRNTEEFDKEENK